MVLGPWIPKFYYWGLNQYITQRTLGSASLAEGQKGIVFSAFMKLLIPFVIVVPGIIVRRCLRYKYNNGSTYFLYDSDGFRRKPILRYQFAGKIRAYEQSSAVVLRYTLWWLELE